MANEDFMSLSHKGERPGLRKHLHVCICLLGLCGPTILLFCSTAYTNNSKELPKIIKCFWDTTLPIFTYISLPTNSFSLSSFTFYTCFSFLSCWSSVTVAGGILWIQMPKQRLGHKMFVGDQLLWKAEGTLNCEEDPKKLPQVNGNLWTIVHQSCAQWENTSSPPCPCLN